MLSQQKQQQNQRSQKLAANLKLITRIQSENNNIKSLIKAMRDRSSPHHQSTINDSDGSNIEIKSDNNPVRKGRSRSTFQDLSLPSSLRSDEGDFRLNNKNGHVLCNDKSQWNKIHTKLECIKHQNIASPTVKVSQREIGNQHRVEQRTTKMEKKMSVFRIKEKMEGQSFVNFKLKQKYKRQQENPQNDLIDIRQIDVSILLSHIAKIPHLQLHSTPQQIYHFFESLYRLIKMQQDKDTIIKRYSNCIYFGQRVIDTPYFGMIWYYRKVCYIGQLISSKKHGIGIQVNLQDQKVWRGTFQCGHKTGYFQVQAPTYYYYGNLSNGQYHGEGHLSTSRSEFKGNFCQGIKQGVGFQTFSDKKQYRGQYFNDKFDGQGELKATDYYYKGLFKNGKPDGHGFERTNQYQYLGNFASGKKQGKGKLKTKNGMTINCRFQDNLIVQDQICTSGLYHKLYNSMSKQLSALHEQKEEGTIEHMLSAINRQPHKLAHISDFSHINYPGFSER